MLTEQEHRNLKRVVSTVSFLLKAYLQSNLHPFLMMAN